MPPRVRQSRANRVEVKQSGKGRALRIDGTFASWYEPGKAVTGSVWDALAAPLLLLPKSRRDRVLILGLGGGSAARVARALAPGARITGVEIDAGVVRVARRYFDLDGLGIEVVKDDAHHYLERTRRRFDVILDDVFVGNRRTVRKPDWLPDPGLALASDRLRPGGILVSNTIDETVSVAREMRRLFSDTLQIEIEDYDNRVVVGAGFPLSGRALRTALMRNPTLSATAPRFKIRKSRGR
ncbi:MAG: fused MFS/spermidine synthase [Deltaproteobacteria bacterium]|nr:fused MFS/spermidine synthase [Deltaproteobacteria bacterium]